MPRRFTTPARPGPNEYLAYYGRYIDLVPDGDVLAMLDRHVERTCAALLGHDAESATHRPSPGEWSPLEIGVHLVDAERILGFRAFTFARHDGAELPGVEFEGYAESALANERVIDDVVFELRVTRAATLAMFHGFAPEDWTRSGIASGSAISVRALAYTIAGHDLHHLPDLHRTKIPGSR